MYSQSWNDRSYGIFLFCYCWFIPLLIIFFSYMGIIYHTRSSRKRLLTQKNIELPKDAEDGKNKSKSKLERTDTSDSSHSPRRVSSKLIYRKITICYYWLVRYTSWRVNKYVILILAFLLLPNCIMYYGRPVYFYWHWIKWCFRFQEKCKPHYIFIPFFCWRLSTTYQQVNNQVSKRDNLSKNRDLTFSYLVRFVIRLLHTTKTSITKNMALFLDILRCILDCMTSHYLACSI